MVVLDVEAGAVVAVGVRLGDGMVRVVDVGERTARVVSIGEGVGLLGGVVVGVGDWVTGVAGAPAGPIPGMGDASTSPTPSSVDSEQASRARIAARVSVAGQCGTCIAFAGARGPEPRLRLWGYRQASAVGRVVRAHVADDRPGLDGLGGERGQQQVQPLRRD